MGDSSIEWTDKTWNPTRGCRRVSPGCENCYAEKVASRFSGPGLPYEELTKNGRWNGSVALGDLSAPLHWRKPARIFVDSMSDLFYEGFTDEQLAAVFGVMAVCPQHTFQVLTKRPERAAKWFAWASGEARRRNHLNPAYWLVKEAVETLGNPGKGSGIMAPLWPLPNVHIGVSIEDQQRANERLPELLRIPAAVRFVSYEPALGAVNFSPWMRQKLPGDRAEWKRAVQTSDGPCEGIEWLIVGGESGPGARPFDIAWARSAIEQCKAAGVPVFMKQLGARAYDSAAPGAVIPEEAQLMAIKGKPGSIYTPGIYRTHSGDPKNGDMTRWPPDLRVREFPSAP